MKLQKVIKSVEEIEIDLPFYFQHYLGSCSIYGRVEETRQIMITESNTGYEIEILYNNPDDYTGYLEPEYKSNREEFNKVICDLKSFVIDL